MNEDFTFAVRQDVYSIIAATKILHDAQFNHDIRVTPFNVKNLAEDALSSFKQKISSKDHSNFQITEDLLSHVMRMHHTSVASYLRSQYADLKKTIENIFDQYPELIGMKKRPNGHFEKIKLHSAIQKNEPKEIMVG